MEALNKAYAGKGISFYWVLSREPHPGFYGFTQTDSLEMRQEYVKLAAAELQIELPWIIDSMKNTMQKTYGLMPNSEFIVGPDGILIDSTEWADPDKLKEWLEKNIGPSGIPEEKWAELGKADQTAMAVGNNDEVPLTEVPLPSLHPLEISRLDDGEELPFTFNVSTLPPNITVDGQSRLYLTIRPDTKKAASFDKSEEVTVNLSDTKGVEFIKNELKSGRRRSSKEGDFDVYPHTLGVLWTLVEGAARMEFKATVNALIKTGDAEPQKLTATYQVSGSVPETPVIADEVPPEKVPQDSQLSALQIKDTEPEKAPMTMEAKIIRDTDNANQGTVYLFLKVDEATGHKWNNLSVPVQVTLKPVSGIVLEKTILNATRHEGKDDADDRILAIRFVLEPESKELAFEVEPEAWICNDGLGWCRLFTKTFRVAGKP